MTLRFVLTVLAAGLAYFINQVLTAGSGPLSGEAALLQMQNSDTAFVLSKSLMETVTHVSGIALLVFMALVALIWLPVLFRPKKKDQDTRN